MDLIVFLSDWTLKYLKNKDLVLNRIESMEPLKGDFRFKIIFKDGEQLVTCCAKLGSVKGILEKKDKFISCWVTVINSKDNFNFLLNNWEFFIGYINLTLCFLNPFSMRELKWVVKPSAHNLVSEESSLAGGLKAIADNVDLVGVEGFKARIS
tara:strand:- start:3482 stop:3940 length:459 start_codon:yes stop_codon:yes gene_type:complete